MTIKHAGEIWVFVLFACKNVNFPDFLKCLNMNETRVINLRDRNVPVNLVLHAYWVIAPNATPPQGRR